MRNGSVRILHRGSDSYDEYPPPVDNFRHPLSGPGMLAVVTVVGGDSDRLTPGA